jgi:hypothetical protein
MESWVQELFSIVTVASLPTLPWRLTAALTLVTLYLSIDWRSVIRSYYPGTRLEAFNKELKALEQATFDSHHVVQSYSLAAKVDLGIRRYAFLSCF